MRIIGMIATLTAILLVTSIQSVSANTLITDIQINPSIQITFPDALSNHSLLALATPLNLTPETKVLSEEERHYASIMEKWKMKQKTLWQQLPTEPFTINASAYTAATDECGKSDGITSSGVKVQKEQTLACPPHLPFGVQISIEGAGIFTCEDRGGAIKGNHFDIYMETKTEAFAFGRRNLTAKIVQ